jgi:hypothetical protein
LGNKEVSFTYFFLFSEFTVSENNFNKNDINNVIYHEMLIFIGCSIMLIFEKGACGWDTGMPDSFRCLDVAYNLARPQV